MAPSFLLLLLLEHILFIDCNSVAAAYEVSRRRMVASSSASLSDSMLRALYLSRIVSSPDEQQTPTRPPSASRRIKCEARPVLRIYSQLRHTSRWHLGNVLKALHKKPDIRSYVCNTTLEK